VNGQLASGVCAKDVILYVIQKLGVEGGVGYAYEYAGSTFDAMSMEERMTVCNMSIEGGARCGYINPDQKTVDYLKGRPFSPQGAEFEKAAQWWLSLATPEGAAFDDEVVFDAADIEPTVTWGITPAQSVGISQHLPKVDDCDPDQQTLIREALNYMELAEGSPIAGTKIDVAFIGSCTNGRISDLRQAADIARGQQVAEGVKAIVVPGSQLVRDQAMAERLHEVFEAAGFEWRAAGCSMCLAMNPDKLQGREVCASSSNRNFKGRQGSPTGRTLLMSPAMVAAAAISGHVTDIRQFALTEATA
jgi:3-isopropylmalate/(R)-2-methylmalate dehydratase large subunit